MSKQPAFTKLSKLSPFVLVDPEMSSIFKTLAKANATIDKTRTIEIQTSNLNYTALSIAKNGAMTIGIMTLNI